MFPKRLLRCHKISFPYIFTDQEHSSSPETNTCFARALVSRQKIRKINNKQYRSSKPDPLLHAKNTMKSSRGVSRAQ